MRPYISPDMTHYTIKAVGGNGYKYFAAEFYAYPADMEKGVKKLYPSACMTSAETHQESFKTEDGLLYFVYSEAPVNR